MIQADAFWGLTVGTVILILWGISTIFTLGTWYEIDHDDLSEDDWFFRIAVATFWWAIGAVFVCGGVLWCLHWIPRGPARLVLYVIGHAKRPRIPEARVI